MKTIIAEKPSVAREIAQIVGANQKGAGYLTGNGYNVTWAFGHLVVPDLPEGYGIKGFHRDSLPILPPVFRLVPRPIKTSKGYSADKDVVAQIKTIAKLFRESEKIIVATDAGREGELIFRYLYEYIGCSTPFDRLWINSLTDKAIREGLDNLQCGSHFDSLYYAAKARSEADWLVGINATQAVTIAAGRDTYSLGRVQTPTLAMVCSRYWENRQFVAEAYWQLHVATDSNDEGEAAKFSSTMKWTEKGAAENAYQMVKKSESITITNVICEEAIQEPPFLYDLTSLQKEANTKHGFSADKTLGIAQKLYEAKLITYPRTGSRFIPEDVFAETPALLLSLKGSSKWGGLVSDMGNLSRHSVDNTKITDHHAILITGIKPKNLTSDEATIYHMVIGRMLEAFSDRYIKDVTTFQAQCAECEFMLKTSLPKQKGWKEIYGEETDGILVPNWKDGDVLPLRACSLTEGKTRPKPLHTEASLLTEMETAGKQTEDEELRQSLKSCGIGTPATRASIIETLIRRDYIVRNKKKLVPTEKGLALYSVVKYMDIANVEMTGEWELLLSKIEDGQMHAATFRKQIEDYAAHVTSDLLACDKLFGHAETKCPCPKCETGNMEFFSKVVRCDNPFCAFPIFRQIAGKTLSDQEIMELLTKGITGTIGDFNSKQGKKFRAAIAFDEAFNTKFVFTEPKARAKSKRKG